MSARPHAAPFDVAEFMRERSADYGRELPRRVAALCAAVADLEAGRAGAAEVEREAHSLAGSAGTFGFVEVSHAARAIELALGSGAAAPLAVLADNLRSAFASHE